jgi:hypothetical protein
VAAGIYIFSWRDGIYFDAKNDKVGIAGVAIMETSKNNIFPDRDYAPADNVVSDTPLIVVSAAVAG